MRIWSLYPELLDRQGLVALWRETLLAQAVLARRTKGYTRHPQLDRFRALTDPHAAVVTYLHAVRREAQARGYHFRADRIDEIATPWQGTIAVTSGQVVYEYAHLVRKLEVRSPDRLPLPPIEQVRPHPLFHLIPGPVASWEKV